MATKNHKTAELFIWIWSIFKIKTKENHSSSLWWWSFLIEPKFLVFSFHFLFWIIITQIYRCDGCFECHNWDGWRCIEFEWNQKEHEKWWTNLEDWMKNYVFFLKKVGKTLRMGRGFFRIMQFLAVQMEKRLIRSNFK